MLQQNRKDKEKVQVYLQQAKEYRALQQRMTDTQIRQSENKDKISNLEAQIEIEQNKVNRLEDDINSLDAKKYDVNINKIEKAKKKMAKLLKNYQCISIWEPCKFELRDIAYSLALGVSGIFIGFTIGSIILVAPACIGIITKATFKSIITALFTIGGVIGTALLPFRSILDKFERKFLYTEKRIKSKQAEFERKSMELQKSLSSSSSALAVKQNLSKEINQASSVIDELKKDLSSCQKKDKYYKNAIFDIQGEMNNAYVALILISTQLKNQGLDVPSIFDEESKALEETTVEEPEAFDIESIETKEKPKVKKRGKFEGPKKPTFGIDSKNVTETLL